MQEDLALVRDGKGKQIKSIRRTERANSRTNRQKSMFLKMLVIAALIVLGMLPLPFVLNQFNSKRPAKDSAPSPPPQKKGTFDSPGATKVSGRVYYVEVNQADPTVLNSLVLEEGEEKTHTVTLRSEDRMKTPLTVGQKVECTVDSDFTLRSVVIVAQDEFTSQCAMAIKTLDNFMELMQKKQWTKAQGLIDPLTSKTALNEDVLKSNWKRAIALPRSSNKYLLNNYNGHYPQSYRILYADEKIVLVVVNNSQFFGNLERMDRFSLTSGAPNWQVGRITTDCQELPPNFLKNWR